MIQNDHTPLRIIAEDSDGSSDDDPGPSPVALMIHRDAWWTLGDIEGAIAHAVEAIAAKLPDVERKGAAIVLSSDEEVAALNAQYRGQAKPTNVLSFPSADMPGGAPAFGEDAPTLGDIIIAYETVIREAREDGKEPLHHLAHLTVHGLLHLAGYDHEDEAEAEEMEALEREILAGLNIPDPYRVLETVCKENG